MPNDPPVVYWDACCFIGRIMREPDKIADLEELTKLAEANKLKILTSTITIAEVLHEPDESLAEINGFDTVRAFFKSKWLIVRAVDRPTADIASELRRKYKIKGVADSIHMATAIRWNRKVLALHTYDGNHMLKYDGIIGTPPLKIIKPRYPEEFPLLDNLPQEGSPPTPKPISDRDEVESDGGGPPPDSSLPADKVQ